MGRFWTDAGTFILVLVEVVPFKSMFLDVGLLISVPGTKRPLPRRLQELAAQCPYTTSPDSTMDGLLTGPCFSTRCHDALFVRVEALYADDGQIQSSPSPVRILTDALNSKPRANNGEHVYLWDQVKAAAVSGPENKSPPAILSDDTVSLLSLVSTDHKEQDLLGIPGPASTLVLPLSPVMETFLSPTRNANDASVPVRRPTLPSSTLRSPKDWAEFSGPDPASSKGNDISPILRSRRNGPHRYPITFVTLTADSVVLYFIVWLQRGASRFL